MVVLEATDHVGGAIRTAEITAPGFSNDVRGRTRYLDHPDRHHHRCPRPLLVPGKQNIGLLRTIVHRIVGAIIGFFIARAFGVYTHGLTWIEHFIQVVVAAILVAIVAGSGGRRRRV